MKNYLFTSESVTEGHPDKVCDKISDAILDNALAQDPESKVACETLITTGLVVVSGEITTSAKLNIDTIVRSVLKDIGYNSDETGIDYKTCKVTVCIETQSPDIALGVNESAEKKNDKITDEYDTNGAGDQGIMYGYACNETREMMPMAISLAHSLTMKLAYVRKNGILEYVLPDGKSQVTIEYKEDIPVRVDTVILSTQHTDNISTEKLRNDIFNEVILPTIPENMLDEKTKIYINPTGRFVVGGPKADTGLTGRKIIVDTYGGYAKHGGGAFSGKDPSKVDRSAAYATRYAAKSIVASGLADKCEIQLSYAIGIAKPMSININTFSTGKYDENVISDIVKENFDIRPAAIIEKFDLKRPIYEPTASYGYFGRKDIELPWEKVLHIE